MEDIDVRETVYTARSFDITLEAMESQVNKESVSFWEYLYLN